MPGSRTTLPHTAITLLLSSPLSCSSEEPGQVSDPQGCRTVILPMDADSSTTGGTGPTGTSAHSTGGISSTNPGASSSSSEGSTTGPVPFCGDGTVDEGEECDDNNNIDSDECPTTCENARCGDGFVQDAVEECDDGNDIDSDVCPTSCKPAACGDGFVQDGVEECDDGNQSNTDACTNACMLATCGDGYAQGDEECDDGNSDDFDGCSSTCAIERIVFVSSGIYKGDSNGIQGLDGADTWCKGLAESANLTADGQTFIAWLSAYNDGPATRFPTAVITAKGPFLLPDDAHTKVAKSWEDLTDGDIEHTINIDEKGFTVNNSMVWTNTTTDGQPSNKGDCSGWTNSANMVKGGVGFTTSVDIGWTDNGLNYCSNSARIYCFQVFP